MAGTGAVEELAAKDSLPGSPVPGISGIFADAAKNVQHGE